MLTLSGYQAPNIILDIQPGGNHVIEDSHKKVCCPALSVDRSSDRSVLHISVVGAGWTTFRSVTETRRVEKNTESLRGAGSL